MQRHLRITERNVHFDILPETRSLETENFRYLRLTVWTTSCTVRIFVFSRNCFSITRLCTSMSILFCSTFSRKWTNRDVTSWDISPKRKSHSISTILHVFSCFHHFREKVTESFSSPYRTNLPKQKRKSVHPRNRSRILES